MTTMEEAAKVFATERPVVEVGGRLVDEETGEILGFVERDAAPDTEEPVPEESYDSWLQEQHRFADEQMKEWAAQKALYGMMLHRRMGEGRHIDGPRFRSRYQSGGTLRKCKPEDVQRAVAMEVIGPTEVVVLSQRAVKEYDPKAIDQLVAEELLTRSQARALITETPRAGYVQTAPLPQAAKALKRRTIPQQ